jgi:hypothetical protein
MCGRRCLGKKLSGAAAAFGCEICVRPNHGHHADSLRQARPCPGAHKFGVADNTKVLRLTMSWNFVGCCIGKSAFSPLRMRPT